MGASFYSIFSVNSTQHFLLCSYFGIAQEPGKNEVANASWGCFLGRKQKAPPHKQSRDALSTSLLPGLLRNSEVANKKNISLGKLISILFKQPIVVV